jgi:hypothetical protein
MRLGGWGIALAVTLVLAAGCSKPSQTEGTSASSEAPATAAASAVASESAAAQPSATATAAASPSASTATVAFADVNGIFAQQAIVDEASLGVLDSTSGNFNPNAPITRATFARWLVKASDAYFKDDPSHQIRPADDTTTTTFVDVPPSNADFKYIQGLANAGFVIGKDATHFAPDKPITREEMIAIKVQVDEGGTIQSDPSLVQFLSYSDKNLINVKFLGAVHEDGSVRTTHNIARIWGTIKVLQPRKAVTRAEAAVAISQVGSGSAAVALGRTPPPK